MKQASLGGSLPAIPTEEMAPSARPLHAARLAMPPKPQDRDGFAGVLRRGDFRRLWAAQAASQLADKFLMFTLLIYMFTLTGRASYQSVLLVAYTLPSVLLSAPAGVYADRHDKRTLMIATNMVRGALILLIPLAQLLFRTGPPPWLLIVVTLLFSSAGQVFAPAEAASIPSLVARNQITEATSLFMTTVILTIVVGVPAATLAIGFLGNQAPFYIATALFCAAGVSVWRIGTSLRASPAGLHRAESVLNELREGYSILRDSPALRLGLYQLTMALVVVFTVFALGPAYMVDVLHRSDKDTYIVLVPATFGLVATAAVLGQRRAFARAATLVFGVTTGGVTLAVMGIVPPLLVLAGVARTVLVPIVAALAIVFGSALGALLIPAFTVLQERTDPRSRGRIFGGIFMVINAAVAVPLLVAGALSDLFGVDRVVAGLGVLLVAAGIGVRAVGWKRLAVLEEDHPDPAPAAVDRA